jgi:hypothetical protein
MAEFLFWVAGEPLSNAQRTAMDNDPIAFALAATPLL